MAYGYTKEECRRLILDEWRSWVVKNDVKDPKGFDGLLFYGDLQRENGHLLNFRASGDKWQTVHSWLISARLVSD